MRERGGANVSADLEGVSICTKMQASELLLNTKSPGS